MVTLRIGLSFLIFICIGFASTSVSFAYERKVRTPRAQPEAQPEAPTEGAAPKDAPADANPTPEKATEQPKAEAEAPTSDKQAAQTTADTDKDASAKAQDAITKEDKEDEEERDSEETDEEKAARAVSGEEGAETEEERDEPLPEVAFDDIEALRGVLPRVTEAYEIQPQVKINGPYYRFYIKTAHGDYQINSIIKLLKACYEIHVLEGYRRNPHLNPALKGSAEGALSIGKGILFIGIKPGQSIKGVGRMTARLGRGVGEIGLMPFVPQEKSDTGENRAAIPAGKLFPKQARQFAYEHDLDVYTENPYVRELIGSVATKMGASRWAVKIASKFIIPIPYLGAFAHGALTPGERDEQIERLISQNSAGELYRILYVMYRDNFGLSVESDKEELTNWLILLHNPNYSPREITYSYRYLRDMAGVEGRAETVKALADVRKIRDAMLISRQLELLTALHLNGPVPLVRLIPHGNRIAARTESDGLITILPEDVLDETETFRETRDWLLAVAAEYKPAKIDIWTIGTATPAFRDASQGVGVGVRDGILREKIFQTSRTQKLFEPVVRPKDSDDDDDQNEPKKRKRRNAPLEEKVSPNPPKLEDGQHLVS